MNTLKGYRVSKGLTQTDMAKAMDMAIATYCNKETGKRQFTNDEMKKIAEILELDEKDIRKVFFAN